MKLRTKYILLIVILHTVSVVLSFLVLENNKVYFIVAELLIILSLWISFHIYKELIQPIIQMKEGINAIKDRDFTVKYLPTGKPEVDELIEVYNQMMDALRAERTLQESQHFFLQKMIDTSPTGILILDYDQQIKQVNPKALQILGNRPETFISQVKELEIGQSKILRIGGFKTFKVHKSHFIDRGFARVFLMIEELTAELFAAEKNAYGKVIRMMAHEVNNTIGPVNSIIQLALDTKTLWKEASSSSLKSAMQVAADRNQNLNVFMRNYADLVKLEPAKKLIIDAAALVRSIAEFMQIRASQQQVDFEIELPEVPYQIAGDPEQLEQALINIVKNAVEACQPNGRVGFFLNEQTAALQITNNGRDISPEIQEQLFRPFYSTKKDGQGIGLTLVREILVSHGFGFSLKTRRSGYTVFEICLKPYKSGTE